MKAERDENTCRKDFAPTEAVAHGERLEKMLKPEAEARKKAGQAPSGKLPEGCDTRDAVGSAIGVAFLAVSVKEGENYFVEFAGLHAGVLRVLP